MNFRKQPPNIIDAVEFDIKLPTIQQFNLHNNTPVYAYNGGEQEIIMIEFVFYAGNWYEDKNIIAATTNSLLKNGTKTKNALTINEYFEFYGAHLDTSTFSETATVTLHTLSKNIEQLLPVMSELFTDCTFPEDEISTYKKNAIQQLEVKLKKCDFVANRLIDEYIYGTKHPYGKYTTIADFKEIQRDDLIQFYNEYYTNGKCLIFVAGKLPSNLQELLNKHFGSLAFNSNKALFKSHTINCSSLKKHVIENDKEGVQGAVRIARNFPDKHHPDYINAQILNTIFGGFFGSRLMKNIREDKGYTYGIYSYIQNHINQTAWMISTEAGKQVCTATIEEVFKEMQLLCNEPVSNSELLLVRNYMMGNLLGNVSGPFQIIARWKSLILNNLEESYFYNSIHSIKTTDAHLLQELANKYFNPNEFYELTVI
jgi:zinc protease